MTHRTSMTPEQLVLYQIREEIARLAVDDQTRVHLIAMTLRRIVKDNERHASMAFALVGAEEAAK